MNTRYTLIEEEMTYPEFGTRTAYGIKAMSDEASFTVSDISFSKPAISALLRQCNELRLSPVHLTDVIYDFLVI